MKTSKKQEEDIEQMVHRVINEKEDWSRHMAHTCCKCQKCTCGKHKCKFQQPKFGLKPTNTTYYDSYKKYDYNYPLLDCRLCSDKYEQRQFVNKSQYRQEYYRKKCKHSGHPKIQQPKPSLTIGGPQFLQTTYKQDFTPKKGIAKPDLIKNPQNLNNYGLRMNGSSSYRQSYNNHNGRPQSASQCPIKHKDNLHVVQGCNYGGTTCYRNDYHKMKPFDYRQSYNFKPHNAYCSTQGIRAKSAYRSDYTQKRVIRCPAQTCC